MPVDGLALVDAGYFEGVGTRVAFDLVYLGVGKRKGCGGLSWGSLVGW